MFNNVIVGSLGNWVKLKCYEKKNFGEFIKILMLYKLIYLFFKDFKLEYIYKIVDF